MPTPPDSLNRVFIVTIGRTGSSLLASILADSGADFGLSRDIDWAPAGGTLEHPEMNPVVRNFQRMNAIGARRPAQLLARLEWTYARHLAKSGLKKTLPKATYFKGELDTVVHWAARFGYFPKVIVSYRPFGEVLKSLGHLHPQLPEYHANRYASVLRNGLALATTYGGCVVDYHELVDDGETGWASAIAETTGLEAESLLAARDKIRKNHNAPDPTVAEPFPECREIYDMLRRYKGAYFPTSHAANRAMTD